jgi:voltage-gated potassium channel
MTVAIEFLTNFIVGLGYISPILFLLLLFILAGAWIFHRVENRPLGEAVYMALITAITIGYGDMTPTRPVTRATAVLLGIIGVIFTGIMVSLAVYAANIALGVEHAVPAAGV